MAERDGGMVGRDAGEEPVAEARAPRLPGAFSDGVRARLRSRWKGLAVAAGAGVLVGLSGVRLGGGGEAGALGGFVVLMAFGVPVLLTRGLVSGELRSGAALLWLQKPVSGVGIYLGRFFEALGASLLVVILAVGGGASWAALSGTAEAEVILRGLPVLLLLTILVATVGFGFSATGLRSDGALTVLYIALLVSIAAVEMVQPGEGGTMDDLIRVASFPLAEILEIHAWITGEGSPPLPGSLRRVMLFEAAWLGGALLLTARSTRAPFQRAGN